MFYGESQVMLCMRVLALAFGPVHCTFFSAEAQIEVSTHILICKFVTQHVKRYERSCVVIMPIVVL